MKKILIVSFFMALNLCVYAQNTLNIVVKNSETKEPLIGVTTSIKAPQLEEPRTKKDRLYYRIFLMEYRRYILAT
jgi:iron complex outermembrane receptor protein